MDIKHIEGFSLEITTAFGSQYSNTNNKSEWHTLSKELMCLPCWGRVGTYRLTDITQAHRHQKRWSRHLLFGLLNSQPTVADRSWLSFQTDTELWYFLIFTYFKIHTVQWEKILVKTYILYYVDFVFNQTKQQKPQIETIVR